MSEHCADCCWVSISMTILAEPPYWQKRRTELTCSSRWTCPRRSPSIAPACTQASPRCVRPPRESPSPRWDTCSDALWTKGMRYALPVSCHLPDVHSGYITRHNNHVPSHIHIISLCLSVTPTLINCLLYLLLFRFLRGAFSCHPCC